MPDALAFALCCITVLLTAARPNAWIPRPRAAFLFSGTPSRCPYGLPHAAQRRSRRFIGFRANGR